VNKKKHLELDEYRTMNTHINTGHSFSSSLTNQNNGTSNGSSFFVAPDDRKKLHSNPYLKNQNYNNQFLSTVENEYRNFLTPRQFITTNPYALSFTSYASENNNYKNNEKFHNCSISNMSNMSNVSNIAPNVNTLNYSHFLSNSQATMPIPLPVSRQIKFNPNEDKSVLDNLLILIKDQNGCRMIQRKLEEKREDFISKFFEKIKGNIYEVICDQFGNYVIQKFVECCSDKNIITSLLDKLKHKMIPVSTNCYGTRGFQRILDFISEDSDHDILKEILTNNIFSLIKDVNGNHVIQKLINIYPINKNGFIIEEIIKNIVEISKLKQGSCIFQKIIDKIGDHNKVSFK
jgi:hypothetical protein